MQMDVIIIITSLVSPTSTFKSNCCASFESYCTYELFFEKLVDIHGSIKYIPSESTYLHSVPGKIQIIKLSTLNTSILEINN